MTHPSTQSPPVLIRWAGPVLRAAADFLYPPACRLCSGELPSVPFSDTAPAFCDNCRAELIASRGPVCKLCAASIGPHLDPEKPCVYCRDDKFSFDRSVRLGVYDGHVRRAILRAKDRTGDGIAAALAELLWEHESAALQIAGIDLVVPVPHFWLQRWLRPHNAAETIADVLSTRLQLPPAGPILKKRRWTPPQTRLTPPERRKNLRNAFTAGRNVVLDGATVLLTDDVMTTGATAHEAARALRGAGAAHVMVAVIARGLGRR